MSYITLKKYIITNHALNRYVERILSSKSNQMSLQEQHDTLYKELEFATENKSVWNNTSFITYTINKYGSYDYHFLTSNNTIFVTVKKPNSPLIVITCYDRKHSKINHLSKKRNNKRAH